MNITERVILLLCFLFVILFSPRSHADDWSTGDTYREVTFQTLWVVDFGQTRNISEHTQQYYETNHYLGQHPTLGAVDRYFIVGAALHAGIAYVLPESLRAPFQYVTIGIETGYVAHNFHLGIGVKF